MAELKTCNKCRKELPVEFFTKRKDSRDGFAYDCKACRSTYISSRYRQNPEKYKEIHKKQMVKDQLLTGDKYHSTHSWRRKNPDRVYNQNKEYLKKRRQSDIAFRIRCNLRSRLAMALKSTVKSGSAIKDLGCTIPELKQYLESRFVEGMTWENWSRSGWHIDHIMPLTAFDLSNRQEILRACHFTNLQPLWSKDNQRKGGKKQRPGV